MVVVVDDNSLYSSCIGRWLNKNPFNDKMQKRQDLETLEKHTKWQNAAFNVFQMI